MRGSEHARKYSLSCRTTYRTFSATFGQQSLGSSAIGGSVAMREMLDFAARNKVHARAEVLLLDKANDAIARLWADKARYRMVLTN